jgi:hypothetical protein
MSIDWTSLALVAVTTVVAAVAIVGIFALGVAAITTSSAVGSDGPPAGRRAAAKVAGFACIGVSGMLVLYGLYLIIPSFH